MTINIINFEESFLNCFLVIRGPNMMKDQIANIFNFLQDCLSV